jgi:NAD+ synthase (glutamine-hydrolysing)
MTPEEVTQIVNLSKIAEKVKKFFFYYGINRQKTTVLPPSYHMSAYSPDSNRLERLRNRKGKIFNMGSD